MRVLLGAILLALAGNSPSAREVIDEVQRRAFSKSFRYEGRLSIRHGDGAREEKAWRYERLGPPGNSKYLLRFTEPAEIRGVALLVWNRPDRPADMWLYTPSISRARRIARQDRSSRFAGSALSFEDLEEDELSRWDYSELAEEPYRSEPCYRLTARRSEKLRSQYDRVVVWISKEKMTPLRIDKHRAGKVVRRLEFERLEQREGVWTPMETAISDLEEGALTRLRLEKVRYGDKLADSSFTLEAMKGAW